MFDGSFAQIYQQMVCIKNGKYSGFVHHIWFNDGFIS